MDAELALFNKVGDLYQKTGKVAEAADTWERAMNRYADGGFANNAIALCNKILRVAPGRTPVYLKLAQLMVARGLAGEAKQYFLEYADRMQKSGQLNQAFKALKEFADLSPNNQDIRMMLAEQLKAAARTDEARDQLAKLYAEAEASGDTRRSRATLTQIKAIDPDYDPTKDPKAKAPSKSAKSSDLVFLDLDAEPAAPPPPKVAPGGFKRSSVAAPAPPPPAPKRPSVATPAPPPPKRPSVAVPVQPAAKAAPPPPKPPAAPAAPAGPKVNPFAAKAAAKPAPPAKPVPPPEEMAIERSSVEFTAPPEPEAAPVEGLETGMNLDVGSIELDAPVLDSATLQPEESPLSLDVPEIDLNAAGDLQLGDVTLDLDVPTVEAPTDIPSLEAAVSEDPDDPARHRALGEALLEVGERERGIEELDLSMAGWETKEEWQVAQDLADEILRLDPNSIRHHQKRVEYAFRLGDRQNLINSYLELADAFFRSGASDRAVTVYQRVLEHDAGNQRAVSALQMLEPAPSEKAAGKTAPPAAPAKAGSGDFVDMGSFLDDDEDLKVKGDARMRIQDEEPTGDEERDFADMLSQFKKGIEQTVDAGDAQTHYDLGVAFKEMGLLDEGIAEFQKALQGKDMKNQASEALGVTFFEKGQPQVAGTVLRRAIEGDNAGDDHKIGLLYWLGRCEEEQGRSAEALTCYQRVFAVNIRFQDVNDRVKALAKAGR